MHTPKVRITNISPRNMIEWGLIAVAILLFLLAPESWQQWVNTTLVPILLPTMMIITMTMALLLSVPQRSIEELLRQEDGPNIFLRTLPKRDHPADALREAAAILAKRGDWSSLEQLLCKATGVPPEALRQERLRAVSAYLDVWGKPLIMELSWIRTLAPDDVQPAELRQDRMEDFLERLLSDPRSHWEWIEDTNDLILEELEMMRVVEWMRLVAREVGETYEFYGALDFFLGNRTPDAALRLLLRDVRDLATFMEFLLAHGAISAQSLAARREGLLNTGHLEKALVLEQFGCPPLNAERWAILHAAYMDMAQEAQGARRSMLLEATLTAWHRIPPPQ